MRTQKYFQKNFKYFFAHKKLKKPPQKVAYLWQFGGFFSAQNSPELHFRFINSSIQPSVVESVCKYNDFAPAQFTQLHPEEQRRSSSRRLCCSVLQGEWTNDEMHWYWCMKCLPMCIAACNREQAGPKDKTLQCYFLAPSRRIQSKFKFSLKKA